MAERSRSTDKAERDVRPDAWERFEAAVDHAVKTPAMHRETKKVKPENERRVPKGKSKR